MEKTATSPLKKLALRIKGARSVSDVRQDKADQRNPVLIPKFADKFSIGPRHLVIEWPATRMNSACMKYGPYNEATDVSVSIGIRMDTEKIDQVCASDAYRCNEPQLWIAVCHDLRNCHAKGLINL